MSSKRLSLAFYPLETSKFCNQIYKTTLAKLITGAFGLILLWNLYACGGADSGAANDPRGNLLGKTWGLPKIVEKEVDGKIVRDTQAHTIPYFAFIDQDSAEVNSETVKNKVYVADFFFTSCPTICPKVKKNTKKVYEAFKSNPDFILLSHSIDPQHDTVGRLAWYATKLKIDSKQWHLLTGDKEAIYTIAKAYLASALEDQSAPGGFDHSGGLTLVDRWSRIRGVYDGLDPKKVDQLIEAIPVLLQETSPEDIQALQ